nr:hypothetical protein [Vibrio parahaemolyticus]
MRSPKYYLHTAFIASLLVSTLSVASVTQEKKEVEKISMTDIDHIPVSGQITGYINQVHVNNKDVIGGKVTSRGLCLKINHDNYTGSMSDYVCLWAPGPNHSKQENRMIAYKEAQSAILKAYAEGLKVNLGIWKLDDNEDWHISNITFAT